MIRTASTFLLAMLILQLAAQDQFGGHPSGLKWRILDADAIRLIYPEGMKPSANRVASLIDHMHYHNRKSIGAQHHKINMLIQNQTIIPNGYVALAPFRSELFSTPPQSITLSGSLDWMDILAVHEYRHVQQYSNANRGITKVGHILFGEQGWAAFSGLSVPNWYWEGDAVIMETALSKGGRGRAPFFTLEQRALAHADKNYTYIKQRNGSLKSLLPSHYPLGYMMLTHIRDHFGNSITADIFHDAADYDGIIYPFSQAVRRYTGLNTKELYQQSWQASKEKWEEQLENIQLIPTKKITPKPKRTVTNYRYPKLLEDGSIIAIKSSYKKTQEIVRIRDGKEEKLCHIGIHVDPYLALGGDLLTWTEAARDGRRGYQVFSDILIYDLHTRKRRRLTKRGKWFSPAPAPDARSLAAIHISPEQENQLILLQSSDGRVLDTFPNPENWFLSRPAWTPDGQAIICVARHKSQLTLAKYDVQTKARSTLLPWTSHTLDLPIVHGNRVYFQASFNGIDNIYATDIAGHKPVYPMSSVAVGAYDASVSPDGKELLFAEFTDMGFQLSRQSLNFKAAPVNIRHPDELKVFDSVANTEEGGSILEVVETRDYESRPYRGLFKGLKLHSWSFLPSYSAPSASIQMNNIRNDLAISAGGGINFNEDHSAFYFAQASFARYYPVLSMSATYQERVTDLFTDADTLSNMTFNESSLGGSVTLPLAWYRGNFVTRLEPSISVRNRQTRNARTTDATLKNQEFTAYDLGLSFSSIRRTARQNVGTRAGLRLAGNISRAFNAPANEKIWLRGSIFLPGLFANHNLELKGAWQRELLRNPYQYPDAFEYTRGYDAPLNDEFINLSVNYGLPLAYPDWGFAGLIYFMRIRANLFYDQGLARIQPLDRETDYRSAGIELLLDNSYFNVLPITLGLRQSFLLEDDPRHPDRKRWFELFISSAF